MYLKEIEIQGFKSFADKTKVVFDQGVTAVVGPNGSGKSNITESLRWALGESSVKSPDWPGITFPGQSTLSRKQRDGQTKNARGLPPQCPHGSQVLGDGLPTPNMDE